MIDWRLFWSMLARILGPGLAIGLLGALLLLGGCASTPAKPLRVGDVVTAKHFRHASYNGQLVKVTGAWGWRFINDTGAAMQCYEVTARDGRTLAAQPFQLQQ